MVALTKSFGIAGRLCLILLCSSLFHSCLYMLEKKNNAFKDIDKSDIAASFADGSRTLPVIFLETDGHHGINNKEYWKGAEIDIFTAAGHTSKDNIQIKGRGNSTWSFPKKPFNIRFKDGPSSILGLPEANKFCALANWRDHSRIRNAIALEIARQTSMEWTPQGCFADLVLDGNWHGNYYFTEKVEPEKLALGPGGYMLLVDDHYNETYHFHSIIKKLPVNIIIGDDLSLDAKAFSAIKSEVECVEYALYKDVGNWMNYIDIQSFCDWFLIHEITGTDEPSDPKGIYMYCRGDGILHAGPCWDFDYHTFRPGHKSLTNPGALWFDALLKKSEFKAMLKQRWSVIKPLIEKNIPPFISQLYEDLHESMVKDYKLWPIKHFHTNGDESLSFADATQRIVTALRERITVLDNYCDAL